MLVVTKLNGTTFALNEDLIETIEETPDTVIRLTTNHYHIVKESMNEVIEKIVRFKRSCVHSDTFSPKR